MKYLYFAKMTPNNQNQFEVTFPDLAPNAATYGSDVSDALKMAQESLEGYLLTAEDFNEPLPAPSEYSELDFNPEKKELLVPIEVDTKIAREREENKTVKKTLTIPKYLNDLGNEHSVNFSATLTDALEEKLAVYVISRKK